MKTILKWVKRISFSILSLFLIVLLGLLVSFYFWKKEVINDLPKDSLVINTQKGQIEYSLTGNSDKYMLIIHGTPGSVHVEENMPFVVEGFNVLAVSRPGYYKTPLSSGKTPKEQASLYKSLLDKLNIDTVYVNAVSGGGPSGIQFALDYPERCAGLILRAAVSENMEEEKDENGMVGKFFGTEFGIWLGFQIGLTQVDEEMKKGINRYVKRSMFPMEASNDGYKNDIYQFANFEAFPLEKIIVPTIIIHGDKDDNVPFVFAQNASRRIPNSTLFEMKGKDHYVFLGSYSKTINSEIILFMNSQEEKKN